MFCRRKLENYALQAVGEDTSVDDQARAWEASSRELEC